MSFVIKNNNFYLNEKKTFLTSGEIHYFRIKRELWELHLQSAVDAGLTTVSTYIPWAFHEKTEGVFDFEGQRLPETDLKTWLELCQQYGLYCILKPGPFILAEFRGAGLPDWFMEKHGQIVKMRNSQGQTFPSDGVSLFNEIYLEKVTLWYDHIMPFINKRQISAGGPVIMMQICNEIGVFSWLAHQADYSPKVKEKYISYLSKKFDSIETINSLWNTNYTNFAAIELPPDGKIPYVSRFDKGRDYEWHCFWRRYYGDYLRMLTEMARERGIIVPVYHNLPGWIYGSGFEFPVNITMYEDLFRDKSEIVFGVDHIPEYLSYRNMHDDRIINDITRAMQGNKPLFAAEFQCGSREYHVVTNPREMELFYKASVANGLTGWNYYMFSQGRNTRHTGYSGSTFYWFNPLTAEGTRTPAFPLVQKMNRSIRTIEEIIVNAERKAEICVLFYPPYYSSELERPLSPECGLTFAVNSIRRPAYFDGLLKVLQILNIDYDMIDLTNITANDLKKYKQIWLFSTDEMDASEQRRVVNYTKAGGNLIVFPFLPDREMNQKPCNILREALNIEPHGIENTDSPLIDVYNYNDIKCANPQSIFAENDLEGAEIIARTIKGSICGFSKKLGEGVLTHLGTWIGFDTEGHKPVYEALLNTSEAVLRQAESLNENIVVRQRFTPSQSGLLFIANYFNEEYETRIFYTHPIYNSKIPVPYFNTSMLLPGLYGILSPLSMELTEDIRILHSTSDILNIDIKEKTISITLIGDRDLPGEIVFEGDGISGIKIMELNGVPLEILKQDNRNGIVYSHTHKCEMLLKITLE